MAAFEYTALDLNGKTRKGVIESDSVRHARQLLREKEWAPLSVEATVQRQTAGIAGSKSKISISLMALAGLTRQLATLLAAGVTLEESLKAIAEQNDNLKVKNLIMGVRSGILEGNSFARSLELFPQTFSRLYCSTVEAGERTGHLDLVLDKLADYIESKHETRQKIQLALLYPVILLGMSLAIVSGLLAYVVPKVTAVFIDTGQQLPLLTRALIATSGFVAANGMYMLVLLVIASVVFKKLLAIDSIRLRCHQLALQIPVVSHLAKGIETARFASTLSILVNSGVVLVEAMRIATEVITNSHIKKSVQQAGQKIVEGESLFQSLEKTGCFPPMLLHMVGSGEKSGNLGLLLQKASRNQEKELENYLTVMVRLLEPLMLVGMGVLVMLIVLAILLPILNMNQLISL